MLILTQGTFDHEFGVTFTSLLASYDDWSELVVKLFEPVVQICIDALSKWFDWSLLLHPNWKHILIVLALYMTNYISNNVNGRWKNVVVLALVLPPLALFGSVGFGVALSQNAAVSLIFPIIALVTFAIIASVCTTVFYPPQGQTPWQTFRHYWRRTVMPFIVIGLVVLVVAMLARLTLSGPDLESFTIILFAVYIFSLALNLLIRGPAKNNGGETNRTWRRWFSGSLGPQLGTRIMSVYILAALQIVLDQYVLKLSGM